MNFSMFVPTRVLFGAGELNNLHSQPMPGKKALLLISNGKSAKESGALRRTEEQLRSAGVDYAIFNKIAANPVKTVVMEGGAFARENGCDFIVALGGGSVLDASKAIAAVATNPGDLWDYIIGGTGKGNSLINAPLPIIAITTTAGTGSEVDAYGVITNEKTHEKIGFGGDIRLFPVLSIVDPELMLTVPPIFTAYQGFDALFHSVECYISKFANLASDMVSLTAIQNVAENLPAAVKNGTDIETRTKVAFANTMSGYAMVYGSTSSQHSLEHAMSAFHGDLPHGAGLIMLSISYFTHAIEKHSCDERFITMAQTMGIADANEPMDFIKALTKLQQDCGVAGLKMSDYGILPAEFEMLAVNAKETMGGLFECDRSPLSITDCIAIYQKAYR